MASSLKRRVAPWRVALGMMAFAALPSASAIDGTDRTTYYWQFVDRCLGNDAGWYGGSAQSYSCWNDSPTEGIAGDGPPRYTDDVFILAPTASADTMMIVYPTGSLQALFMASARNLTVAGNLLFAAGMVVDKGWLSVETLALGYANAGALAKLNQSDSGTVTMSTALNVFAGAYTFAGGVLQSPQLNLYSQFAPASYLQTGGNATLKAVTLRSEFGFASSFSQTGGVMDSTELTLGSLPGAVSSTATATLSGPTTRWTNLGLSVVGGLGPGALEIRDGARMTSGSAVVAQGAGVSGTVTVDGASSAWAVEDLVTIGGGGSGASGGNGRVVGRNGAQLSAGEMRVNGTPTAGVALSLSGAGTALQVGKALIIGDGRAAQMEVLGGATLASDSAIVGDHGGGQSFARLAGAGAGALWTVHGSLLVGAQAEGRIDIEAGATLRSGGAAMGKASGGYGIVSVLGPQALWSDTGTLMVGQAGTGSIGVSSGGRLETRTTWLGTEAGGFGKVAVVDAGSTWANSGDLVIGRVGAGNVFLDAGSTMSNVGQVVIGDSPGAQGSLALRAAGAALRSGPLTVARSGAGTLTLAAQTQLDSATARIGDLEGSRGQVDLKGGTWRIDGSLQVGSAGHGEMLIDAGGLVQVRDTTRVGTGSVLVLAGTLRSGAVALPDASRFDWRSGTLHITGSGGAALDGQALPAQLTLAAGRTLQVDRQLALNPNSTLLLGGGRLLAGTLALDNALFASTDGGAHALDMDGIGLLSGRGQVGAALRGSGTGNRIAATGALTLGLASRNDGYAFGGTLDAGSNKLTLLDADLAELGTLTTLAAGGQLSTLNGAVLGKTGTLRADGNASVQGDFINQGAVVALGGTLSLLDDVSGAGSFAGAVRFLSRYAPGGGVAQVGFGGGSARFDPGSTLVLDIVGTTPGTGFDRLAQLGKLSFEGQLTLAFGPGFAAPAGGTLSLFDFGAFEGQLGANNIAVVGFDRARLDFTRLAVDGTLSISAVPEPPTWVLTLAGIALLLARRRQRLDA